MCLTSPESLWENWVACVVTAEPCVDDAMLPLSLVLCVIVVKGFEVRVGNSFKGKSGGVLRADGSILVFKFMAFISVDKFPWSPPALSSCVHTHDTRMWTSHSLFPLALPHKVSRDLLALSYTPHRQGGAAQLMCHSSSTVDLCPKREADSIHLPPEPVEVTSLGLEFQRQKLGQGEGLS